MSLVSVTEAPVVGEQSARATEGDTDMQVATGLDLDTAHSLPTWVGPKPTMRGLWRGLD